MGECSLLVFFVRACVPVCRAVSGFSCVFCAVLLVFNCSNAIICSWFGVLPRFFFPFFCSWWFACWWRGLCLLRLAFRCRFCPSFGLCVVVCRWLVPLFFGFVCSCCLWFACRRFRLCPSLGCPCWFRLCCSCRWWFVRGVRSLLFCPSCRAGFCRSCGWVGGVSRGVVAFAGSRALPAGFAPLVAGVASGVVASGRAVAVGCCVGVDSVVLSSVPSWSVRCFAAFGVGGVGACSLSAVSLVSALPSRGGLGSWLAGGSLSVPLPARLSARTRAVVGDASVCAVVFFASPSSRGSFLAARAAVARGLPVFAFACGFDPELLPSLGDGDWSAFPISDGLFAGGFEWFPAHSLFLFA